MSSPTVIDNPEKIGIGISNVYGLTRMMADLQAIDISWFYNWGTQWEDPWSFGSTASYTTDLSGNREVIFGANSNAWFLQNATITGGQAYDFSFTVDAPAKTQGGVVVNFKDNAGNVLDQIYVPVTANTQQTFTVLNHVAPTNATLASVVAWSETNAGITMDDFSLVSSGQEYLYNGDFEASYTSQGDLSGINYTPMAWGAGDVNQANFDLMASYGADTLLTFNEPNANGQANMTVAQAIALWPSLMATGMRLGSPATTTPGTLGSTSWLGKFMAQADANNYRVDFIAVHYYTKNQDIGAFQTFLQNVYNAYQRPIWVTEWGLVDWNNPQRFTYQETAQFLHDGTMMMDDLPFVERHAWYSMYDGMDGLYINTNLFNADGSLTLVGDVFTQFFTDPVPVAPTNNLVYLYESDADAQNTIADSQSINLGTYLQKTQAVAFETGADITALQMIYEQGGYTRGLNLFVENGMLYAAVWNKAEENWGYKELSVAIAANTTYTATLIMDGLLPANGKIDLYLDGQLVGTAAGVGQLYSHSDDIGIDMVQQSTLVHNKKITAASVFSGQVEKVAQYNTALTGAELDDLHEYMGYNWLVTTPPPPVEQVVMEFGSTQSDQSSHTVTLNHTFIDPVVFLSMTTYNGYHISIPRITDVQNNSFSFYIQEADYLDGTHSLENVSYFVVERGSWVLSDGTIIEAGTHDMGNQTTQGFDHVSFLSNFGARPAVLTQVQTDNGTDFVEVREKAVDAFGFDLALQEQEANLYDVHPLETIAWLAIEQGAGSDDGHSFVAQSLADSYTDAWKSVSFGSTLPNLPQLLADISGYDEGDTATVRIKGLTQTGAKLMIQEDQSLDTEVIHTTETIDFFAIDGSGFLTGLVNTDLV